MARRSGGDGLEQVVRGVLLEGADGVLVEGGDEDEQRRPFQGLGSGQHVETVLAGHLDVLKHQVGAALGNDVQGFLGRGGPDGFHVRMGLEQVGQLVAGRGFVVDDQGTDGHGRPCPPAIPERSPCKVEKLRDAPE